MNTIIYFSKRDIRDYIEREVLPKDILNNDSIGICSLIDILEIIEEDKTNSVLSSKMREEIEMLNRLEKTGCIFITSLVREKVIKLIECEWTWNELIDKKANPYILLKTFELYPCDENEFWDYSLFEDALR